MIAEQISLHLKQPLTHLAWLERNVIQEIAEPDESFMIVVESD